LIALDARARTERLVHWSSAALAVEELSQQMVLGGAALPDHLCAPGADVLHAIEQLVADDRLV
jgi:hypothetical protein